MLTSVREVQRMTVSMRVMHAGDGYKYLLRSVAAGDGNRSLSTPLTRYYAEVGTPPGRWLGSGLPAVGGAQAVAGAQVTEAQLGLLVGLGRDPVTGEPLGRAYPEYKPTRERVDERVRRLDHDLSVGEINAEISRIEAEEAAHSGRRAVAGYDFTFSVPKSVSVLWGVADANTQELIVAAHHAAVGDVVDFMEREVAVTRAGVANADGAVAQVATHGLIAAAYDHWDSRAHDPQLHTHVVISNKVQADLDGRWRSLDSRPMHGAVTAVSAYYNAVLADRLTGTFGLGWEQRARGADRNPQWEITGVPESLVKEFSSRTRAIEVEKQRMIDEYVHRHGRRPNNAAVVVLRARATLATRPEKQVRSLEDLTAEWRHRAGRLLGRDATGWARSVISSGTPGLVSVDRRIPAELVDEIGAVVVAEVARKRATWRRWNLWAEASRQTMHLRFTSAREREALIARVVESAEMNSVALTPPEPVVSPAQFRREDGTSVFRPRHSTIYSSTSVMAAEDRVLAHANDFSAPVASPVSVAAVVRRRHDGRRLTPSQAEAITAIATSRRQVDLLVGPAGAGKTTAMHALLLAWTREHGRHSVVGLAPSAAAAEVLASDLGIACENTAKWLHDHSIGLRVFRRGQLVILDEATLADTATLDEVTGIAAAAGAKVLLVGDWAQLQSVDAGGAFAMLAATRNDVAELTEIHRFTHDWERAASVDLRAGRIEAITAYAHHDRLRDGTTDNMREAAYAAWISDQTNGLATILVADSTETMHALNVRARAQRVITGQTTASREVALASGEPASTGDLVITRRNDRRLRTPGGVWVRNGDRWRIDKVNKDGSLTVSRQNGHAATLTLPSVYVAEHVDLGYAITAHRAQGVTVDTAHALVSASTTKESLYVSMTRGRRSNNAYVALDQPDETHTSPAGEDINAQTVLFGILQRTSVELSAHQTIASEQETWTSIAQLAAEYDTIAAAAQRPRWEALLRSSGLTEAQTEFVITGDSFGPLTAALRRAEACGHNIDGLFRRLVSRRDLSDADDIGAVLQHRLRLSTDIGAVRQVPATTCATFIAGMIAEAVGAMAPEMREALGQRRDLIEGRAAELAEAALVAAPVWLRRLGDPPNTPAARRDWLTLVATVAAYRDRYGITSDLPLGPSARTEAERADRRQALAAQRRATAIAGAPGSTRRSAPISPQR
ncbi:MobF family relaxase [Nocardioides sp. NPDC023903]|uniref:MobF family relaxase n=1 Tax=Nocardioides sp. NPDC023903 TaxID=3157195 RepID=UPI0033D913C8